MLKTEVTCCGVTPLQMRLLLNAALSPDPQTASALNDGLTVSGRGHMVAHLVRAGFLARESERKRPKYTITPLGREFAEYLQRLEMASG